MLQSVDKLDLRRAMEILEYLRAACVTDVSGFLDSCHAGELSY